MDDLICASNVFFGDFIPLEDITLVENKNPESILIAKSIFQSLSNEAKEVINIILNAPNELFLVNGKFKKMELSKILRENKWSFKKIYSIQKEISEFCQNL